MNTQEQTLEQAEQAAQQQIAKQLEQSVKLGRSLQELKKNKAFKAVFEEVFLTNGLDILWQNVRHLKEEQLKGRGSEKNIEVLALLEGQIKSRLDMQGFMDTVEVDANNAIEELRNINADITAEVVAEAGE